MFLAYYILFFKSIKQGEILSQIPSGFENVTL